jgi:hypothetical protein
MTAQYMADINEVQNFAKDTGMSFAKRLWKIGKNFADLPVQTVDFFVDTALSTVDDDSQGFILEAYDSFQDNIMGNGLEFEFDKEGNVTGTSTGDSVIGSLFGPEGIIGATIEAIPEGPQGLGIRQTGRTIWSPLLENLTTVQKYAVDRPIGVLVGGLSMAEAMLGNSENRRDYEDTYNRKFSFFDLETYKTIYNITENRSAGQALAIYTKGINPYDVDAVKELEETAYYKTFSGINDFAINIYLDAPYLLVKAASTAIKLNRIKNTYAQTGRLDIAQQQVADLNLGPLNEGTMGSEKSLRSKNLEPVNQFFDMFRKNDAPELMDYDLYQNWGYTPAWLKGGVPPPSTNLILSNPEYVSFKNTVQKIVGRNTPQQLTDAQRAEDAATSATDLSITRQALDDVNALDELDLQISKTKLEIKELDKTVDTNVPYELRKDSTDALESAKGNLRILESRLEDAKTNSSIGLEEPNNLVALEERLALTAENNSVRRNKQVDDSVLEIVKAARRGQLGRVWAKMPIEQQVTYAKIYAQLSSVDNVVSEAWLPFDNFHRLILGDQNVLELFEKQAGVISEQLFKEGVDQGKGLQALNELQEINNLIAKEEFTFATNPGRFTETKLRALRAEKKVYEKIVNETFNNIEDLGLSTATVAELNKMPWNALLDVNELIINTLQRRVPKLLDEQSIIPNIDFDIGYGLDNVIDLAKKELSRTSSIPTTPDGLLPHLGPINNLGFQAKTFFMKTGLGKSRAYRVVSQKLTQSVVDPGNTEMMYQQLDRFWRDIEEVTLAGSKETLSELVGREFQIKAPNQSIKEYSAMVREEFMQQLMNATTIAERVKLIDSLVDNVVASLTELVLPGKGFTDDGIKISQADIFDKSTVIQILRKQINTAQDMVRRQAEKSTAKGEATFGSVDHTNITFLDNSELFDIRLPLKPSQAANSLVLPRLDAYKQLLSYNLERTKTVFNSEGKAVPVITTAAERAASRNLRRLFSTTWKRGVLLTPRWQMVVNIDSLARNIATVGASATFVRMPGRIDTLQVRWLTTSGIDVTGLIQTEIRKRLADSTEVSLRRQKAKDPNAAPISPPVDYLDDITPIPADDARSLAEIDVKGIEAGDIVTFNNEQILVTLENIDVIKANLDTRTNIFDEPITPDNLYRRIDEIQTSTTNTSFVDNVDEFIKVFGKEELTNLTENVINEAYARSRTNKRISAATGIGAYAGGPVGAAAAGLMYGKYARSSLSKAAEAQTLKTYSQQARLEGHFLIDAINQFENQVLELAIDNPNALADSIESAVKSSNPNDLPFLIEDFDEFVQEASKTLPNGARIDYAPFIKQQQQIRRDAVQFIENHIEQLTDHQQLIVDKFSMNHPEIINRFDKAASMASERGLFQTDFGSVNGMKIPNVWGDTPQQLEINQRIMSASPTKRTAWDNEVANQRKAEKMSQPENYDIEVVGEPVFNNAWNDYMRRHGAPQGRADVEIGRDWWRQFWYPGALAKTDQQIAQWLRTDGRKVLDELPDTYVTAQDGIETLVQRSRYETESLVPNIPEFQSLRKKLSEGNVVRWDSDVVPILNDIELKAQPFIDNVIDSNQPSFAFDPRTDPTFRVSSKDELTFAVVDRLMADGKTFETAVKEVNNMSVVVRIRKQAVPNGSDGAIDFGKTVTDSSFKSALTETKTVTKFKEFIDTIFENLGAVEDTLSRGTLYEALYLRDLALNVQRFKVPGTLDKYNLDMKDLNNLGKNARDYARKETKAILYDLAERTKFEEMMTEISPFLGAYQEVISRWVGIGFDNPAFVARVLRPFQNLTATDENGQSMLGITFPKVMGKTIPGLGEDNVYGFSTKMFGQFGVAADAGTRFEINGKTLSMFGMQIGSPVTLLFATALVTKIPSLEKALTMFAPYGFARGNNIFEQFLDVHKTSWLKSAESILGDNEAKARTAVRVAQAYIVELSQQGIMPVTKQQQQDFSEEVTRRTEAFYAIRMFRSLAFPTSMQQQMPYHSVMQEFYRVEDRVGQEGAEFWLLDTHPELWGYIGRSQGIKNAGTVTVEGSKAYGEVEDLWETYPEARSFILMEDGSLDSQFEYNRTLARQNTFALNPDEVLVAAAEKEGWREYRIIALNYNQEIQSRLQAGASPNDRNTSEAWLRKEAAIEDLKKRNGIFAAKFNEGSSPVFQERMLNFFRETLELEAFAGRPEMGVVQDFVNTHDSFSRQMMQKWIAGGRKDPGLRSLEHPDNKVLKQQWLLKINKLKIKPDFVDIYNKYFRGIETITWRNRPPDLLDKIMEIEKIETTSTR